MSDPIYEAQAFEIAKLARSISDLKAENAKLRELVKDLYEWEPDDHPTIRNLNFYSDKDTGVCRRMRDLGIEVQ